MRLTNLNFSGRGRIRSTGGWMAPALLIFALVFVLWVIAPAQSDHVAEQNLKAFFEAFVGRNLSSEELREIVKEFNKYHTSKGKTRREIDQAAQRFGSYVKILRDGKGGPADFTLRHIRIEANYFEPELQNSTFLRLLLDPDPVRVVNPRSRRLMTEKDVAALGNLRKFARSDADPRNKIYSRQELDRMVAGLDGAFGRAPKAAPMPQFFAEAAAFWAGVQREWPRMSAGEKSLTRAYANKTWRIQMPPQMYARLLGLTPKAAQSRQGDDAYNRLVMITNIQLEITNLPILLDKIFPP